MNQSGNPSLREIERFFSSLGLTYIPGAQWNPELGSIPRWQEQDYFIENKSEFRSLKKSFSALLEQNRIAPVEIKFMGNNLGRGLVATKDIPQGTFIGEYAGVIEKAEDENTDFAWDYPDDHPELGALQLNAQQCGNELRFVNHSFSPNCIVEHCLFDSLYRIFFLADRHISQGEELTVDYGDDYWTADHRELLQS
jgi:SET domain-containing protein